MTYERVNGKQNMNTAARRPAASAARREYPGADYATTQFVTKLRSRGSANAPHARTASSDLMQNAYKIVPQRQVRPNTANVREADHVLNNKYSPYSDVNVSAAKKAQAPVQQRRPQNTVRSEEARQSAHVSRQARPASNIAPVKKQQAVTGVPAVKQSASAVKMPRPSAGTQLAESGPREVAVKRVPFPRLVLMILMFAVIIFLMIQSVVQNFEYQREITSLQAQLDNLNNRSESLRLELEERVDLAEIEHRAEEIGMIKSNSIEEKYISLKHSDIIENFGSEKDEYGSLTTMLSAVSRRLSKFFSGSVN